jgi:hypothetical protein
MRERYIKTVKSHRTRGTGIQDYPSSFLPTGHPPMAAQLYHQPI